MKKLTLFVTILLVLALTCSAYAATRQAKIISIRGKADIKPMGKSAWVPAKKGMLLSEGDVLRTASRSRVTLNLNGNGETALVKVEPGSQLLLSEMATKGKSETTLLDLALGEIMITAEKLNTQGSKFEVKTPTSVVGVRGTKFAVKVEAVK